MKRVKWLPFEKKLFLWLRRRNDRRIASYNQRRQAWQRYVSVCHVNEADESMRHLKHVLLPEDYPVER